MILRKKAKGLMFFESLPGKRKITEILRVLYIFMKTHRHGENTKRSAASFIFADIIIMTVSFTHMQSDRKCTVPWQYGAEMPSTSLTYRKEKKTSRRNCAPLGECTLVMSLFSLNDSANGYNG